ncbi:MAG: HNH endonuclease [Nitrospirae bacterium]|nr:MAG: HNH endonuclease [Nitrospirota bacterium]
MTFFVQEVSGDFIKRERSAARELRKTSWWKRKCAEGKCRYCNSKANPKDLTMDHIVPIIRGGRSQKNNVVPVCKECNNKKKHMLPLEWAEYMDSLSQNCPDTE